jgi:hypothetical protein
MLRLFVFLPLLTLALAGCVAPTALPPVDMTWLSLQAARTAQEGMLDPAKIDQNRVYAAKLRIGAEFFTLTTNAPLILSASGSGDARAISAMRFGKSQDEITLFTRNPENGEGYRAIIPLTEANDWPQFSFPFLRGGKLETLPVQVVSVIRRPDPDDDVRGLREYLQRAVPAEQPYFIERERPPARPQSDD